MMKLQSGDVIRIKDRANVGDWRNKECIVTEIVLGNVNFRRINSTLFGSLRECQLDDYCDIVELVDPKRRMIYEFLK